MSIQSLLESIRSFLIRQWQPPQRPPYQGLASVSRIALHYHWDAESVAFAEALEKELEAAGREVLHLAYWPEKRKRHAPPAGRAAEQGYARGEWNWLGVPRHLSYWRENAPDILIDFGRHMPAAAAFYRHTLPVALRVAVGEGGWADVHLPGNWAQHPFQQSERVVQYLKFINNPENETAKRNRRGFGNAL